MHSLCFGSYGAHSMSVQGVGLFNWNGKVYNHCPPRVKHICGLLHYIQAFKEERATGRGECHPLSCGNLVVLSWQIRSMKAA